MLEAFDATHDESSFDEFLVRDEPKLGFHRLRRFRTPEVLASQAVSARRDPP